MRYIGFSQFEMCIASRNVLIQLGTIIVQKAQYHLFLDYVFR